MRIYPSGGRYDVSSIDWRATIVHDCEEYVVVNKPAGIPCCPTTSNFHENVMECLRKELGCEKLYNPHRLDVGTTGVLVFGKTKEFAREFGFAIRNHEVAKTYKLLVVNSFKHQESLSETSISRNIQFPPIGSTLTHYMATSRHYPKILHATEIPDSKVCVSIVKDVSSTVARSCEDWRRRFKHDPKLMEALDCWGAQATGAGHDSLALCEVQLQLMTGRTHQLRAQVSEWRYLFVLRDYVVI